MDQNKDLIWDLANTLSKMMSGEEYKHDLPSGYSPTNNLMHGPSGVFGGPGLEQQVFASRVKPKGLSSVIPGRGTIDVSPVVAYLTGFTDSESGTEPTDPCDDPLRAGLIKSCVQGAAFGRVARKTSPLRLVDIGLRNNRSEFMDLRVVNDPIVDTSFFAPNLPTEARQALNSEVAARMLVLGSAFENVLYPMMYNGSPANNTASNGYMEFPGLQTTVGTGKVDILTNTSCPSLDSIVIDWNYSNVTTTSSLFFAWFTSVFRNLRHNASRMSMGDVQWVIVMREDLFHELADIWPCVYATYRCTVDNVEDSNLARVMVDGMAQRAMSDDIRNGMYLIVDGRRYPVIIDDGIPELTDTTSANLEAGEFSSDIYILPLTVRGGIPVTYMEYRDFSQGVAPAIAEAKLGNVAYVSDGGRFLWYSQFENGCFAMAATIEPRLRLLTPHLAARIQNVMYSPYQHFRDPFNDDPYFVNGGDTSRSNAPYLVTAVS